MSRYTEVEGGRKQSSRQTQRPGSQSPGPRPGVAAGCAGQRTATNQAALI